MKSLLFLVMLALEVGPAVASPVQNPEGFRVRVEARTVRLTSETPEALHWVVTEFPSDAAVQVQDPSFGAALKQALRDIRTPPDGVEDCEVWIIEIDDQCTLRGALADRLRAFEVEVTPEDPRYLNAPEAEGETQTI